MKYSRPIFLLFGLLLFTTFAFAGPQIAVSDPNCNGTETINMTGPTATYVITAPTGQITVCNGTGMDFTNLNFTLSFPSQLNLATIYCGGPDQGAAPFDYCNVFDPANQDSLIHTFSVANGDTPSSFYGDYSCAFGCDGPVPDIPGSLVHLSLNLFSESRNYSFLDKDDQNPCDLSGSGLLSNCRFTITFACPDISDGAVSCDPIPVGTGIAFTASNINDNPLFPAPVPEPASIFLTSGVVVPVLVRKFRKRRRA
jgi:hypothetical protein